MLKIPLSELRLLRTLAKSHGRIRRRSPKLPVIIRTDGDDLLLQVRWQGHAIERRLTGLADDAHPDLTLVLSLDVIADCLRPRRGDLRIAVQGETIALSWTDKGVDRRLRLPLEVPAATQSVPGIPDRLTAMPARFREDWTVASACSNPDSVRYALGCVQMDGRGNDDGVGRLVATDGVQAILASGYDLPWPGQCLVPSSVPLAHRQLPSGSVKIGRVVVRPDDASRPAAPPQSDHVCFHVMQPGGERAEWTFWAPVEAGRFPDVERIVPQPSVCPPPTRLALDRTDAVRLAESLAGLPGGTDDPVTLQLSESVEVTAGEGASAASIPLPRSRTLGQHRRVTMRRSFLERAASLGFDEIELHGSGRPAVCRSSDHGRTYVWMTLHDETVGEETSRVERTRAETSAA